MSRASRLKVAGTVSFRFSNSPITRVQVEAILRGRTASSGFPRGSGHHELGELFPIAGRTALVSLRLSPRLSRSEKDSEARVRAASRPLRCRIAPREILGQLGMFASSPDAAHCDSPVQPPRWGGAARESPARPPGMPYIGWTHPGANRRATGSIQRTAKELAAGRQGEADVAAPNSR